LPIVRLHVLSDLHLEFDPFTPPPVEADVIVLAGDVHVGQDGVTWARKHWPERPVIYVLGNHEFYREALPEFTQRLYQRCAGTNIHLLENEAVEIQGVTFLGCTLWTDLNMTSEPALARAVIEEGLSDYKLIRVSPDYRPLRAHDTAKLHAASVDWLKTELARCASERLVIVTHHAPSPQSIPPLYAGQMANAAFASNLEMLVAASDAQLWIHGHTHHCVDYRVGMTRVLSNQRGYPDEGLTGFDPGLVVEV
jgi:predicted phosphodiesterase